VGVPQADCSLDRVGDWAGPPVGVPQADCSLDRVGDWAGALVLIDTGSAFAAPGIHAALRAWSAAPVHTVVFTHGHIDHVMGVARFESEARPAGAPPFRVVAHEAIRERFERYRLTAGYNAACNARQFAAPGLTWPVDYRDPDVVYRDSLELDVVRNLARMYAGWWDGNPARLKPPRDGALAGEVSGLAGGTARLIERAGELSAVGEHALACQLAEWAVQAAPGDDAVRRARAAIYRARAAGEDGLMARNIFRAAADEV
jgi:alkyl sulfatase BDS1-like metallo-beta-lactamase superfamily hydrolase